jgi:hypothetical protein
MPVEMNSNEFVVKQIARDSKEFGNYNYEIYQGSKLVAHYRHDYRGDEQRIRFIDGGEEDLPFGRCSEFLKGGGPEPLELSFSAISYLSTKIGKK